jgi:hypothetical protein
MNNQISLKLAAVVVALMVNGLIMGGVAYMFESAPTAHTVSSSAGQALATHVV